MLSISEYHYPPRRLDIVTQNVQVSKFFYELGYDINYGDSQFFPKSNSIYEISEMHVWLAKLLWDKPVLRYEIYSAGNKYDTTSWISGRELGEFDIPF